MFMQEIQLQQDSLIATAFDSIDYSDSFLVVFENRSFATIKDFALEYFLSQPSWLRLVSQNTLSLQSIQTDIQNSRFKKDTNIGSWKIYAVDEKEIVFGEEMGFMQYRFSLKYKEKNKIQIATVVHIKTLSGKFYFSIVKLLHKKFILLSIEHIKDEVC